MKDNYNNIKVWTSVDYDTMDDLMDLCIFYGVTLSGLIRTMIYEGVEQCQMIIRKKKSQVEKNI